MTHDPYIPRCVYEVFTWLGFKKISENDQVYYLAHPYSKEIIIDKIACLNEEFMKPQIEAVLPIMFFNSLYYKICADLHSNS